MKHMKMLVPMILAVCLSACADGESKQPEQISDSVLTIARAADKHDYLNTLMESYSKENGVTISVKEYQSQEQFMTAVIGGEKIDVIYSDENMDISSLISKGYISELSNYISEDEYVSSVIEAMKLDGKLYELPYDFDVESAIAKCSLWGNDDNTSFSHILEKTAEQGCEYPFDITLDSYGFVSFVKAEYVDLQNHTCSFDSTEFERFIRFMKEYYTSVESLSDEQLYNEFRDNNMLILATGFSSFDQLDYLEKDIGESVRFVGYPSDTENFHIAVPRSAFSVAEKAGNKEAAVDFVKYCTSYDAYITKDIDGTEIITHNFSLPINRRALEKCCEISLKFASDDDIEEAVLIANRDELMRQINTLSAVSRLSDRNIQTILTDELSAYFTSDKDPRTVCRNIQNRCMIMLWEQYE